MIAYLQASLSELYPERTIEVYGLDFNKWTGVEAELIKARSYLSGVCPGINWNERIKLSNGELPFDEPFDFIVTNQVFEHVADLGGLLSLVKSALKPDGLSINLFPLKYVVWEAHCKCPFPHWIRSERLRHAYLSSYAFITRKPSEWPDIWTRKLSDEVSYRSEREIVLLSRQAGLDPRFSYTFGYYLLKLRSLFRNMDIVIPKISLATALKYISSVTVVMSHVKPS